MLVAACQGLAMMAQSPAYKIRVVKNDGSPNMRPYRRYRIG